MFSDHSLADMSPWSTVDLCSLSRLSTTEQARARATTDRLIAETTTDSAEFPVMLANHLPMILEILCRLGASSDRLEAYGEAYNRVNAVPALGASTAPLDAATWRAARGDRTREADLRAFFVGEAQRLGRAAIRIYMPDLVRGVGASAFHGLMRLAYGVLRDDFEEIGTALGYWAATYLPLRDEPNCDPVTDEPLALAIYMREQACFQQAEFDHCLLWNWIHGVGNMDAFGPVIGRLAVGPNTLDKVAAASTALYASTMSFEALHAFTGSYWVRLVAFELDDPLPLVRHFWQGILSVYPKIGMPLPASAEEIAELRALAPPPDVEIAAAAVASDDEHDPSLVFTALQEFARTGDPVFRVLAAKRMRLL